MCIPMLAIWTLGSGTSGAAGGAAEGAAAALAEGAAEALAAGSAEGNAALLEAGGAMTALVAAARAASVEAERAGAPSDGLVAEGAPHPLATSAATRIEERWCRFTVRAEGACGAR